MNIRKNIDYSAMFTAMDTVMQLCLSQMELYCELGRLVSNRPEKGSAVAAAEHLKQQYPDMSGFSPRNLRRMRDFYRLYEGSPDSLKLAMQVGWTQNVVILEAKLNEDTRCWYLRATKQFDWSKVDLQRAIASNVHQRIILDKTDDERRCEIVETNSETETAGNGQDAVPTKRILKFKSSIGRFKRKRGRAAFLQTIEYMESSVLMYSLYHCAASLQSNGMWRVFQLLAGQTCAVRYTNIIRPP